MAELAYEKAKLFAASEKFDGLGTEASRLALAVSSVACPSWQQGASGRARLPLRAKGTLVALGEKERIANGEQNVYIRLSLSEKRGRVGRFAPGIMLNRRLPASPGPVKYGRICHVECRASSRRRS